MVFIALIVLIKVPLRLSESKELHASWVVELYNYRQEMIKNGWKALGVTQVIDDGVSNLPALDPL